MREREREEREREGERTGKAPSRCYFPGTTEREIKIEYEREIGKKTKGGGRVK